MIKLKCVHRSGVECVCRSGVKVLPSIVVVFVSVLNLAVLISVEPCDLGLEPCHIFLVLEPCDHDLGLEPGGLGIDLALCDLSIYPYIYLSFCFCLSDCLSFVLTMYLSIYRSTV